MKGLSVIVVALFLSGCGATTQVTKKVCKQCTIVLINQTSPPPPPPVHRTRCTDGYLQGSYGQVFRVECGRVSPMIP